MEGAAEAADTAAGEPTAPTSEAVRALVTAFVAQPDDTDAAEALRICVRTHFLAPSCGWATLACPAFEALKDAAAAPTPAPRRLLLLEQVLAAAHVAQSEQARQAADPCPEPLPLPEVATWVASALRSGDAHVATAGAALWSSAHGLPSFPTLQAPQHSEHPGVAAAAVHALAAAVAQGRTDDAALVVCASFSDALHNTRACATLRAACTAAFAAHPAACTALLDLLRAPPAAEPEKADAGSGSVSDSEEHLSIIEGAAARTRLVCEALCAACASPEVCALLLQAGAFEVCVPWLDESEEAVRKRCDDTVAPLRLLRQLTSVGRAAAWDRLVATSAVERALHSPSLMPGPRGRAEAYYTSRLLKAASAAAAAAAAAATTEEAAIAVATAATAAAAAGASVTKEAAAAAAFRKRAVSGLASPSALWTAVTYHLATSPSALAALADAELHDRHNPLLPGLLARGSQALSRAALLNEWWPIAPLLRHATRDLNNLLGVGERNVSQRELDGSYVPQDAMLYHMLRYWADDCSTQLLASARGGGRQLTAAVSAALLAPRVPHLGAMLLRQAPQCVPLLIDALLDAAKTLHVTKRCRCGIEDWSRREYRFRAIVDAIGTLAAAAFPPPTAALTAAVAPVGRLDRLDRLDTGLTLLSRVVPPFAWRPAQALQPRRAAAASGAEHDAGCCSDSGSDDDDGAAGRSSKRRRHSLLTRADVGESFHGCVRFSVGGATVAALGIALRRASPVLAEAMSAGDGSAADAADCVIPLPPMHGLTDAEQLAAFKSAVEHAYTGRVAGLPRAGLLPLWRLAHALAMADLKRWCGRKLAAGLHGGAGCDALREAFELAQSHCCGELERASARALLAHPGVLMAAATSAAAERFVDFGPRGPLSSAAATLVALAAAYPRELRSALGDALTDALRLLFGDAEAA